MKPGTYRVTVDLEVMPDGAVFLRVHPYGHEEPIYVPIGGQEPEAWVRARTDCLAYLALKHSAEEALAFSIRLGEGDAWLQFYNEDGDLDVYRLNEVYDGM